MQALLDEAGLLKAPDLYDIENVSLVHHAQQALRAHKVFSRDVDYIVKDGKVIIIDEFTGRMMEGRRYSDGLHQALEAKETVPIQAENQTLASITFQNYFRLYEKLAGMTGTAATEAAEFAEIYRLNVVEIPTHRPMVRKDEDDEVYRTAREKNEAIVEEIEARTPRASRSWSARSRSRSPSTSPTCSRPRAARPHQVLNARYHEQEAYIIAQAGRVGAVTIATNMAGRGTDIQLGGNAEDAHRPGAAGLEERGRRARRRSGPRSRPSASGSRRRRPLHHRHRAPREPPHRQPAARPLRPPGRSRPLQVLLEPRGRPDAPLRLRAHGRHAAAPGPQGGRGDHPPLDQQGDREGAAEGRGPQLRDPQAAPEVRRRDERPAQGRLRAAPGVDGGRGRPRHGRRHAPRHHRRPRRPRHPGEGLSRAVGHRASARRTSRACSTSTCRSPTGPRRRGSPTRRSASACARPATRPMRRGSRRTRRG